MAKIVILTAKSGDLGNRLFRFARFYCSKPDNVFLIDLSLYQFCHLFAPKPVRWRVAFLMLGLLNNARLNWILRWMDSLPWTMKISLPRFKRKDPRRSLSRFYTNIQESENRIIVVEDNALLMDSDQKTESQRLKLQNIFPLKARYVDQAKRLLEGVIYEFTLVGVHIRKGDYRTFVGGRYFFDNREYLRQILSLSSSHTGPKPLAFILISDEDLQIEDFIPANVLYFGRKSVGEDQALLGLCDFIIGPPSTFSGWVCFLRDIPHAEMTEPSKLISWDDFNRLSCNYISV